VNKLLGDSLRPFLLAFSIAHLITALGLSLLILLVGPLLSRESKRIVTMPLSSFAQACLAQRHLRGRLNLTCLPPAEQSRR